MGAPTPIWRLDTPRSILHGGGSRRQLPHLVRQLGASRILMVTDPGVVALGVAAEISEFLRDDGLAVEIFDQVQADPTDENVARGVAALHAYQADIVVALGGGSPIDAAKVIALRSANPQPLSEYMGLHKIARRGLPLIAVPTTAGTGSEATKVAVITDVAKQVKMMMLSLPLLPSAAIVDHELTHSMPPALTAAVGVDTLTHGIEAYISRRAHALTDPIALQCVSLVARHLRRAWENPDDHVAREGMMLAATLGGLAFSNSSVCLVHGMSRPIGAVFHLPHGLSNAVLLPEVTRYSIGAAVERYATIARAAGCADLTTPDARAAEALIDWLLQLNVDLKVPRLSLCPGVSVEMLEANLYKMAGDALASGSPANNPRVPNVDEVVELYRHAC